MKPLFIGFYKKFIEFLRKPAPGPGRTNEKKLQVRHDHHGKLH